MKAQATASACMLTLALAAGASASEPSSVPSHIRPLTAAGGALLADALQKSPTIRELADRLERGDTVVYLASGARGVREPEANVRYVGTSKAQRFLLITIGSDRSADRQIELLGHELQHAVDVAGVQWVNDASSLARYFQMVGMRASADGHPFETANATRAERLIRKEVASSVGTR
jgi:hypothetical protein